MKASLLFPLSILLFAFSFSCAFGGGSVEWSGIEPHPAVVSPVCPPADGTTVDLAGEWEFTRLRHGADRSQFFRRMQLKKDWPNARKIRVPGIWEDQGVGEAAPLPARVCYGGVRHDFPLRHSFVGNGWYRRTAEIPREWSGKRIWLKVGGVASQGWFWVNGRPVAHVLDYCASRKYEITSLVKPGETAEFVAEVTNAGASKRGSSEAYGCWGGLIRTVELEATPDCFIDDAWVRGDFDKRLAEAHVEIVRLRDCSDCSVGRGRRSVRVGIDGEIVEQAIEQSNNPNNHAILKVPLRNFKAWSPEHPNLYTAKVELVCGGTVVQTRFERFGVRKLEVRGKDVYLNGRPFFFRGVGIHEIDPIHGAQPADRESFRARLAKARAAGFNFARTHTTCQPQEFFDAADELGLMVQPELPYYGDHPILFAPFEPLADAEELYVNFRRHPSFAVYSGGNEGTFGEALGKRFYDEVKARDPDRLVIEQDTEIIKPDGRRDFLTTCSRMWTRGSFNPPCPFLAHEYLNLSIKADTRLEDRCTGLWRHPLRRADRTAWLAKFGLGPADGDRLQDAQHALQATWQKIGIESARKDPYCDGYSFWSLLDCVFVNEKGWSGWVDRENPAYMGQGLFDPFFGEKPCGQTAEGFATFNSPVGVFIDAKPEHLHLVSGEPFAFDVLVANYGDGPIEDATVRWSFGRVNLATAPVPVGRVELGAARKVATIRAEAPVCRRPLADELSVEVVSGDGTQVFRNSWPCWLFPKAERRDGADIAVSGTLQETVRRAFDNVLASNRVAEAKVVIADFGSPEVAAALARGQSVIEVGGMEGKPNVRLGWWFLGDVVGATFDTAHPALARLPESRVLSPLHFRIFKKGLKLPVAGFGREALAVTSEGASGCYLHLAARVTTTGARHILVYGLDLGSDLPEARAILDGVVDLSRRPVSAEERTRAVKASPARRRTAGDGSADGQATEDRRD